MPGAMRPGSHRPLPRSLEAPQMPFAGTVTPAPPTRYSPPLPPPPALRPCTAPLGAPPVSGEHMPVSATLAANEALRDALAAATSSNSYGPVAGCATLRSAAAGYWQRRGLPTSAGSVVGGPGSKPLLYGLLLAIGADVAVPRPSWVSYAAQA